VFAVGELTGLPIPLAGFNGPTSKGRGEHRRETEGKGKEGVGYGEGKGESGWKGAYRHFFFPTSSHGNMSPPLATTPLDINLLSTAQAHQSISGSI